MNNMLIIVSSDSQKGNSNSKLIEWRNMHVEIKELVLRYDTSCNSEHGSGWRHSTKVSIQSLFKCSLNTLRLQIDSFHASGGRLLLEGRVYSSHNICTVQPAGDCVYTYPYLGAFAPPTARSCRAKTNSNMWNRPTLEPWHQTHPGKPECQAPWEVQSAARIPFSIRKTGVTTVDLN